MKRYEVDWVHGEIWHCKLFTERAEAMIFWQALVDLEKTGGHVTSCATLFFLGNRGQRAFDFKKGVCCAR